MGGGGENDAAIKRRSFSTGDCKDNCRTIKVANNVNKVQTRKTKKFKAKLTRQDYSWLSRGVKRNPPQTSKQVFDACRISRVSRTT